jgi:hypothetical protein
LEDYSSSNLGIISFIFEGAKTELNCCQRARRLKTIDGHRPPLKQRTAATRAAASGAAKAVIGFHDLAAFERGGMDIPPGRVARICATASVGLELGLIRREESTSFVACCRDRGVAFCPYKTSLQKLPESRIRNPVAAAVKRLLCRNFGLRYLKAEIPVHQCTPNQMG